MVTSRSQISKPPSDSIRHCSPRSATVYARLKTVGGTVIEQGKTACCYARSEKSWIDDPAGISWETFHTTGEISAMATAVVRMKRALPTPRLVAFQRPSLPPGRRPLAARRSYYDRKTFQHVIPLHRQFGSLNLAEAILNKIGQGKFRAYSAGSQPKGQVNPNTIQLLHGLGYDTSGFRAKSWNEFAKPGAPALDFVFTVCDNAAGETCPVWPGQPMTAHWGVPDPAEAQGSEAEIALAFKNAYRMLFQRIGIFTALPIRSLDKLSLQNRLREIGRVTDAVAKEPT